MSQSATKHHTTTLSEAMLAGERRPITTHNGFRISVPVPTGNLGTMATVRPRRGVSLKRSVEALVNRGISARLNVGRIVLRIYGHSIDKSCLHALGRLRSFHARHPSDAWAHLKDFNGPRHGNWARLRWWGLIEPMPAGDEAASATAREARGWWRLTGQGYAFLRGGLKVPRVALIFDGSWIGWRDRADLIGPLDVDDQFDLDRALMRRGA